jgi:hypothetical protein
MDSPSRQYHTRPFRSESFLLEQGQVFCYKSAQQQTLMKLHFRHWSVIVIVFFNITASAAVHFVSTDSKNPTPPYTSWDIAATQIQDAIDAANAGDEVVVTNGLYATGGRAVFGTMTNRVAIEKAILVRSLNGPKVTLIAGQGVGGAGTNNGDGAIRCVYMGSNAILSGFTVTNGHTRTSGDYNAEQFGGGAWCDGSGVISNCIFRGN